MSSMGLRIARFFLAFLFFAGLGAAVMLLWNGLLPEILGLKSITYVQALGLLVLCRLLFSGLGGLGGSNVRAMRDDRRSLFNRWEKMSPQERDAFMRDRRFRFGRHGHPCHGHDNRSTEPREESDGSDPKSTP